MYAWEDKNFEEFLKKEKKDTNASFFPKGELVIVEKDMWSDKPMPRLAYKFNIYTIQPQSRANYYLPFRNSSRS